MTLVSKTSRSQVPSPLACARVSFAALQAIVRTLLNRRAAYRVSELPDYLLSDIGLKRDDVHDALNADWREDATFRLAMAACRARDEDARRRG